MKTATCLSEVGVIAGKIQEIALREGARGLAGFFMDELAIPESLAEDFARNYHVSIQRNDFDPDSVPAGKKSTNIIFESLNLQLPGIWPKNQLAWHVIRHIFGEDVFDFEFKGSGRGGDNFVRYPNYPLDLKGNHIRLGLAAIGAIEIMDLPAHVIRKSIYLRKVLGKEIGFDLAKTFIDAGIIFPPMKEIEAIASAIGRGRNGETVVLTSLVCPDYDYVETGDPLVPYRYTFEGVNDGVGLVAKQVIRIIPHLASFCERWNIAYRIDLSIADFEADSEEMLARVSRNSEAFEKLCRASLSAIKKSLAGFDADLFLFKKDRSGRLLDAYKAEALRSIRAGDYGDIRKNTGKDPRVHVIEFIAKSSRKFYCDWHGRDLSENEIFGIVEAQGAEYAACGRIMAELFSGQPVIQIAGDRPKMQAFNSMYSSHPTICAKRVY